MSFPEDCFDLENSAEPHYKCLSMKIVLILAKSAESHSLLLSLKIV